MVVGFRRRKTAGSDGSEAAKKRRGGGGGRKRMYRRGACIVSARTHEPRGTRISCSSRRVLIHVYSTRNKRDGGKEEKEEERPTE